MSPAKTNPNNQTISPTESGSGVLPAEAERKLREDAGTAVEAAKEEILGIKNEVATQAGATVEQAKAEIGKVAEKAKGIAEDQKEFVAGQIKGVADAVNKVAAELESSDASTAGYARTLADSVSSFSETVQTRNVDELLAMAQDFGRRQPVVFMSAAALMGFAASRFLTSSANRHRPPMTTNGASTDLPRPGQPYGTRQAATRDTMGGGL
jgi:phage-related tail protein